VEELSDTPTDSLEVLLLEIELKGTDFDPIKIAGESLV
jgi:hypothetical protein